MPVGDIDEGYDENCEPYDSLDDMKNEVRDWFEFVGREQDDLGEVEHGADAAHTYHHHRGSVRGQRCAGLKGFTMFVQGSEVYIRRVYACSGLEIDI